MIPSNNNPLALAAGKTQYRIERSLRLRRSATGVVGRVLGTATSRTKFTLSVWTKQGVASAIDTLFAAGIDAASVSYVYFRTDAGGVIQIGDLNSNTTTFSVQTVAKFRDFSAHMHIVIAYDSTQPTAGDRIKVTVNGNPMTLTGTYPTLNAVCYFNSTTQHYFGGTPAYGRYYDGLISDAYFIDGQALPAAAFGEFDINDTWNPKKYTGTYGNNGVHLEFKDSSAATAGAIGKDTSSNGNNWTPTNISVAVGATNDSLIDSPTNYADGGNGRGNYAVMNPLVATTNNSGSIVLSASNLNVAIGGYANTAVATIGVSAGKWYWEITPKSNTTTAAFVIGVVSDLYNRNAQAVTDSQQWAYYGTNGNKQNGANVAYGAGYGANDVIGVALDMDSGTISFYKNNVSQGVAFSNLIGKTVFPSIAYGDTGSITAEACFGQRAFTYEPPSGHRALNTQNLPTPRIANPRKYFDVVLRTGTAAVGAVTGLLFKPGFVWSKARSVQVSHALFNSVRGAGKASSSNLTDASRDVPNTLTSFNNDGYGIGNQGADYYDFNTAGRVFIEWVWSLGATEGFSITPYIGDGTVGRLIPHGLGAVPAVFFSKRTSAVGEWAGQHKDIPANNTVYLNGMYAGATYVDRFNRAGLSATNVQVGASGAIEVNENGTAYELYAWAEVPGFSKFGVYDGNGLDNGVFVNCGFEPALVIIKSYSAAGTHWIMKDNRRSGVNPADGNLYANINNAEDSTASVAVDLVSNGFKLRGTYPSINAVSSYLYMAFAATPFKTARGK